MFSQTKKQPGYSDALDQPPAYEQKQNATAPPPPDNNDFNNVATPNVAINTQANGQQQFQGQSLNNFPTPVGPKSVEMICPKCQCRVHTKVRHQPTVKTHLACILLSWTFCFCGCCLPYFIDSCRNADHYCPGCNYFIGTYKS